MDVESTLAEVGPRLKRLRQERGSTLAALSERTGISVSTLSRLESGQRRATLELLLTLAKVYEVPLDELVGSAPVSDPRVQSRPRKLGRLTAWPLSRQPGQPQAFKLLVLEGGEPDQRTHEGYEWLYVLSGRLRLLLGDRDLVLDPGEAAEFDTRFPHWFTSAGPGPAELLVLFGKQGERVHLRARARPAS